MSVGLVPATELVGEIGPDVDVVAFSAVQMATGEVADLAEIAAAARTDDVMTVVDATQAVGWLPFDAAPFDVVAAHAYKWMLSPRGTAFMAVRPERLERSCRTQPAGTRPRIRLRRSSAPPLRLADGARRLDTSPAWFMWVGTAPASRRSRRSASTRSRSTTSASRTGSERASVSSPATRAIVFCDIADAAEQARARRDRAPPSRGRLRDLVARLQHDRRRRADARLSQAERARREQFVPGRSFDARAALRLARRRARPRRSPPSRRT